MTQLRTTTHPAACLGLLGRLLASQHGREQSENEILVSSPLRVGVSSTSWSSTPLATRLSAFVCVPPLRITHLGEQLCVHHR